VPMNTTRPVEVTVARGDVPASALDLAREKVGAVLRVAPAPVLSARVTLTHEAAASRQRPAVVRARLDVNGRPVRATVAASSFDEAVDLVEAKLRHGLETLSEKRRSARHEPPAPTPGSWRHGMLPATRPEWFPRPAEDRAVVGHSSYLPSVRTVAEAAEDLVVLEQDWVLFTETDTGADALLERTGPGYRLTLASAAAPAAADLDGPVEVHLDTPRMTMDAALALLDETGTRVVFFVDAANARGRAVYHRYDGHYGTVTPADEGGDTPTAAAESG
jgi:ribosome-associated translation inhibitor RaiA